MGKAVVAKAGPAPEHERQVPLVEFAEEHGLMACATRQDTKHDEVMYTRRTWDVGAPAQIDIRLQKGGSWTTRGCTLAQITDPSGGPHIELHEEISMTTALEGWRQVVTDSDKTSTRTATRNHTCTPDRNKTHPGPAAHGLAGKTVGRWKI